MLHRFPLIFSLLTLSATAQTTASLSGVVTDPDGTRIDGATVQARNPETGATFTAVTNSAGMYSIPQLPAGAYDVSVRGVPAMSDFERKNFVVGAKTKLDVRLDFNTQLGTLGEDRINISADLQRHKPPSGPTPRTPDGKPDLSGVWWRPVETDGGHPQFLPEAEAVAKQRRADNSKDNPQARCLPGAVVRFGPLFELVQGKEYLVIINDDESPGFHQVYLNRHHPADPNPAWYGHNIASWEGDTLVVDRVAFNGRRWLDMAGHPSSPKLHVTERFRRPDLGHLEIEMTMDDPGVLAKPYTVKFKADLADGYDIDEFICAENERDFSHMVGK